MADQSESTPLSDEPKDFDELSAPAPSATGPAKPSGSGTRVVTGWHILSLLVFLMSLLLLVAAWLRSEQQRVVAAPGPGTSPPAPSPTEVAGLKSQVDNL